MMMMMMMMMMRKINRTDFVRVTLMMMIIKNNRTYRGYLTTNFISRLRMIIRMNIVLNRTVVDGE